MTKFDFVESRTCPYCGKSMPDDLHYRETCGKPECQAKHKKKIDAERKAEIRAENEKPKFDRNSTKDGVTLSVEALRRLILDTAKETRQDTEEEIYNKTVQIFDSRFITFREYIEKQLEQIQQPKPITEEKESVEDVTTSGGYVPNDVVGDIKALKNIAIENGVLHQMVEYVRRVSGYKFSENVIMNPDKLSIDHRNFIAECMRRFLADYPVRPNMKTYSKKRENEE